MKLSYPMYRVLSQISRSLPASYHCRKMADYGALTNTIGALLRRKLIDVRKGSYRLTDAGKAALEKYEE